MLSSRQTLALTTTDATAREATLAQIAKVRSGRMSELQNIIKNGADCIVASNSLDVPETYVTGYKLNDGFIGLCGMTSSALANYSVWTAASAKK